ncbi:MAG: 50S ribosomal protein L25/general stress protein Ctc [Oceanospirillaceae bacterium]|uniref:50S ribosomal protein L25/general stress protein Ctc n=2 Tax=unclassified Thalassolituus TaxID=2624967 RepID=UPI000C632769|nr:50S ribosomal protein L25/general stress protein Ctc [Thalassolituus sp. UBA1505]MAS26428.1 50S ribosomal protein L25/general stress protein Ctc [Oceanospirillaceae bacterium]MAX98247.1 50S ribosomal protein L25/general stress protein Ctc [Oceanospirillaceae bacterium]MBL34319.1 50S ribosomal protein L25/general stress protein Ctc [Oceanospirillaceae bacterium]MBS54162.1 50S ribosomal protein L25/general stress protein Ctc [Oceanospirillaceae bacterium]
MSEYTLSAELREDAGKGASRRLRRENGVPAIVYGGKAGGNDRKPTAIVLKANELNKLLEDEAFYSSIITLSVAGKDEQVVLKDLQRHPAKPMVWHADFLRVNKSTKIKATVPLHFVNEESCVGVKLGGGKITHQMTALDIICSAGDLPEFVEVDMAAVEVGTVVHLSELKLPKGVESQALSHGPEHDTAVVTVAAVKGSADEEGEAEESAE